MKIEGKGHLGVLLMKLLDKPYNEVLELLDDLEAIAKRGGYTVTVTKDDK